MLDNAINLKNCYDKNTDFTVVPMRRIRFASAITKAVKYLIEGLAVAFIAYYVGKGKLNTQYIIMIGLTASFVFAILDIMSPSICLR